MNKEWLKKKALCLFDKFLDLVILLCSFILLGLLWKIFFFASFKVPSRSMEPAILPGDRVVVWKPWMGARLFNIFDSMEGKQPEIYRTPGLCRVRRNDVLVFNYPFANGLVGISMRINQYYIKRCLALPGDTFSIEEGEYKVKGFQGVLGNILAQREWAKVPKDELIRRNQWITYPKDSLIGWNVRNFGPLLVPAKNTVISMSYKTYVLYRLLIEWESKESLSFDFSKKRCYLGDKLIQTYQFRQNYYFMAGDKVGESGDSRYWGLVPEPFIVGKVGFISESYEPQTGQVRWDRWLKSVAIRAR